MQGKAVKVIAEKQINRTGQGKSSLWSKETKDTVCSRAPLRENHSKRSRGDQGGTINTREQQPKRGTGKRRGRVCPRENRRRVIRIVGPYKL